MIVLCHCCNWLYEYGDSSVILSGRVNNSSNLIYATTKIISDATVQWNYMSLVWNLWLLKEVQILRISYEKCVASKQANIYFSNRKNNRLFCIVCKLVQSLPDHCIGQRERIPLYISHIAVFQLHSPWHCPSQWHPLTNTVLKPWKKSLKIRECSTPLIIQEYLT